MRKVKVVTGVFCIMALSALGVIADGETCAPDVSSQMLEVLETPVTAVASIETTITAPATKLTAAVSPETTAAEGSASSSLTAFSQTTTASAAETTQTTQTTKVSETTQTSEETTAAPETTEAETTAETVIEEGYDAPEETEPSYEILAVTEAAELTELPEETTTETAETELSEEEETEPEAAEQTRTITDAEYIMICNVVGHEYGANWISEYDKALVVEVIMNRVYSSKFPNTVYGVLMQKGQFPGLSKLVNLGSFSRQVTPSVKAAVDLYFDQPERFQHGYLFYSGDGHRNYFRKKA